MARFARLREGLAGAAVVARRGARHWSRGDAAVAAAPIDSSRATRPRWHLVYYLLAAFDVLAVSGGLYLNREIMTLYEGSVDVNQYWADRLSDISNLRQQAWEVDAPGNDIFDSHDLDVELRRQEVALTEYNRQFAELRRRFGVDTAAEHTARLHAHMDAIAAAMNDLVAEELVIFAHFRRGEVDAAAGRTSRANRRFLGVLAAIADTAQSVREIETGHFGDQVAKAAFFKRFEYLFGGVIVLMVAAVTLYGHKIASAFKRAESERLNYLAALEEKESALRRRVTELSEAMSAVARLDRSLIEATTANHAKSAFLAHMSHELRTPLNAIIGFSEVMLQEMLGSMNHPRYREYTHDIHASGQHLLALINDILDLSKIEAGKLELREEDCDVASAIADAVRLVVARADRAGLTIVQQVAADLPPLYADARSLKQILANLLANAVKFTPRGGRIEIAAQRHPSGELAIAIRDTGIGMRPEQIPLALMPFAQLDNGLARRYEGTGLGLPISASLVKLHGGRLDIASTPNEGTTVVVVFPPQRLRPAGPPPTAMAAGF